VGSQYQNAPRAQTQGSETTASFALTPQWTLKSSHTLLFSEDKTSNRTLPRRPQNSFTAGADYTVAGVGSIGADLRYVSRQRDSNFNNNYAKPFTTIDAYASYDVSKNVALYTRVENLFDKDYQEVRTYNAPGMSVYVGIKANF